MGSDCSSVGADSDDDETASSVGSEEATDAYMERMKSLVRLANYYRLSDPVARDLCHQYRRMLQEEQGEPLGQQPGGAAR